MTRREFFSIAAAAMSPDAIVLPICHVLDARARYSKEQIHTFWSHIWPEAVRDLGRCGVRLESSVKTGEVRRTPIGKPLFTGLERVPINFIITDHIPMEWDRGRALSGVSTRYHG